MVATHIFFHITMTSRTLHSRFAQPLQIRLLFLVSINQSPYHHSSKSLFQFFALRRPFRRSKVFLSQIFELSNWACINGSMPLVPLVSQVPSTNNTYHVRLQNTQNENPHREHCLRPFQPDSVELSTSLGLGIGAWHTATGHCTIVGS